MVKLLSVIEVKKKLSQAEESGTMPLIKSMDLMLAIPMETQLSQWDRSSLYKLQRLVFHQSIVDIQFL